jgi:two-component system nitrogen regulation response regulator NtrX
VRQLKNIVEHLAILAPAGTIRAEDVQRAIGRASTTVAVEDPYRSVKSFEQFKETAEQEFLERRLIENNWNVKRTAELLGMQRSNLYKKIEKYDLKKPQV